jgi:hypothetical protein
VKAADIPDAAMLRVIASPNQLHRDGLVSRDAPNWWSRWDVQALFPAFPPKVVDAKLHALVRRGLLDGCDARHDCRGDFELTTAGREALS